MLQKDYKDYDSKLYLIRDEVYDFIKDAQLKKWNKLTEINGVEKEKFFYKEVLSLKDWKTRNILSTKFDEINFTELNDDGWLLVPGNLKKIYKSIF